MYIKSFGKSSSERSFLIETQMQNAAPDQPLGRAHDSTSLIETLSPLIVNHDIQACDHGLEVPDLASQSAMIMCWLAYILNSTHSKETLLALQVVDCNPTLK